MTSEDARALALAALRIHSPRQFEAVALLRRGLTQQAIAEALGVSQGSVSQTLKRAAANLEKLRQRAEESMATKRNST